MNLPIRYSSSPWQLRKEAREQYIVLQNGCCYHCKGLLSSPPPKEISSKKINWSLFPKNFLKHPIHLHHSHDTDLTIGSVHAYCNAVLWQYHKE